MSDCETNSGNYQGSTLPSARLWVTTRPQLLEEVENSLQVLGFNILPFSPQNQRDFLIKFWGQDVRCKEKRLAVFAAYSLDKLHESMRSQDHDIAGVPLQCMLIGEVLRREAVNYADPDNLISEIPPSIEIGSISELYQRLVKVKLDKYFERDDSNRFTSDELMSAHMMLSVQLLFPDLDDNVPQTTLWHFWVYFISCFTLFCEVCEDVKKGPSYTVKQEDLLNVGLLELVNGEENLKFIHRTIAEFFVGLLGAHLLGDKQLVEFGTLIDTILASESHKEDLLVLNFHTISQSTSRFKHPVIVYFLDNLIGQNSGTQPQRSVNVDLRNLAHSCVHGVHTSIFTFFYNSFNEQAQLVFDKHLVFQSVSHSSLELVKHVCETYEKVHVGNKVREIFLQDRVTVLDIAARYREYSVVEYLINCHGFRELIDESHPSIMMLIHYCVERTHNFDVASVHARAQVVKLQNQLNHRLLEYRNSDDETPLLCYNVHTLLRFELVRLGANVLVVDKYSNTVLHKFLHFSADDYQELVTSIPLETLVKLLQMRGRDDFTLLHSILSMTSLNPPTLQLFKDLGADFNALNGNGRSVLDIAILEHRSVDLLEQLVLHGADWRRTGNSEWNSLHTALMEFNFQAFKYLCLKIVNDLNACNDRYSKYLFLETQDTECLDFKRLFKILLGAKGWAELEKLDLRMLRINVNVKFTDYYLFEEVVKPYETDDNRHVKYEIAKLLLRGGGVASIPRIVLTYDESKLSPELLTLLETHGAIRSEKDGGFFLRYTAMSMSATEQEAYEEVADRLLVQWPLSLNEGGFNLNTPLHYALKHGNDVGAMYLLRKGAYVNARNANADTPLHIAIRFSSEQMVKLLIELGADLTAIDNYNRSPLQLAKDIGRIEIVEYIIHHKRTVRSTLSSHNFYSHIFYIISNFFL